jgi:hypothetical protein
VADRRAALRRPLRHGLDAGQHRRGRRRLARDGEALLAGERRDRQRRSGDTSTGRRERFSLRAAATAGPDGETFFAAWADNGQGGGDTSGRAVRGRPLPIPAGGF